MLSVLHEAWLSARTRKLSFWLLSMLALFSVGTCCSYQSALEVSKIKRPSLTSTENQKFLFHEIVSSLGPSY